MSNQMTTPINSILVANNVKPNDDIQDPIVQEILGNMAESATKQPIPQQPIPQQSIPQQSIPQPQYNYPVKTESSFINTFYDKKIVILTFVMIIAIIGIQSNQMEDILKNINISYVEEYKIYIKYLLLYLILYIIQKYDF
tara:strand:- start:319 stop:738 length:420 start_codon:yes stop_codon:yes gene_type:complete